MLQQLSYNEHSECQLLFGQWGTKCISCSLKVSSVGREAPAVQVKGCYSEVFYGNIDRMSGRLPRESDMSVKIEILVELARRMPLPPEGAPCAKQRREGEQGIFQKLESAGYRGTWVGSMLKKGGWRSKSGSEHKGSLRVYEYILTVF